MAWAFSFSSGTYTLRVGAVARNFCLLGRGVLSLEQGPAGRHSPPRAQLAEAAQKAGAGTGGHYIDGKVELGLGAGLMRALSKSLLPMGWARASLSF